MIVKIVTWNVNSIRQRYSSVLEWIRSHHPDILLLQEIKCQNSDFPYEIFEDEGYNCYVFGQKTFNGVAILSKYPAEDIVKGLPSFPEDEQARYIEATFSIETTVWRITSVYVPNGQEPLSEKYNYKLKFLKHLENRLKECLSYDEHVVIGGDFNIAPTDKDTHDATLWHEKILCTTQERKAYNTLLNLGLWDSIACKTVDHPFTWWDYRKDSWNKNEGLRIDHILLSSYAVDKVVSAGVDQSVRGQEKSSDHAPVWCNFKLG